MKMQIVESSQIHSVGHDADSNTLAITFKGKNGNSTYHYDGVTTEQFQALLDAESHGVHLGKFIKPNHTARKIS